MVRWEDIPSVLPHAEHTRPARESEASLVGCKWGGRCLRMGRHQLSEGRAGTVRPCRTRTGSGEHADRIHGESDRSRLDRAASCGRMMIESSANGKCRISGNVWEWCSDFLGRYAKQSQTNPYQQKGMMGPRRAARDGPWAGDASWARASARIGWVADDRCNMIGFRIARSK